MAGRSNSKSKYKPKDFESTGERSDTCAQIFESMLNSPAWRDLKPRQQLLYVYVKAQFYGKRKPKHDYPDNPAFQSDECFYMNLGAAVKYDLYKRSGNKEFYKDMRELCEHGFIKCVSNGRYTKKKSIYRYSADWKGWKNKDSVGNHPQDSHLPCG